MLSFNSQTTKFAFLSLIFFASCDWKVRLKDGNFESEYEEEEWIAETFQQNGFSVTTEDNYNLIFTSFPSKHFESVSAKDTAKLHNHCRLFLAAGQKCILAELTNWLQQQGKVFEELEITKETLINWRLSKEQIKEMLNKTDDIWISKKCAGSISRNLEILFPNTPERTQYDPAV